MRRFECQTKYFWLAGDQWLQVSPCTGFKISRTLFGKSDKRTINFPFLTAMNSRSNRASHPKTHIGTTFDCQSSRSFLEQCDLGLMCAATRKLTGYSIWQMAQLATLSWKSSRRKADCSVRCLAITFRSLAAIFESSWAAFINCFTGGAPLPFHAAWIKRAEFG